MTSNHASSYCYPIFAHIVGNDTLQDLCVCHKAFLVLHYITNHCVQTLKKQLPEFGEPQVDGRYKHKEKPNQLPGQTKCKVFFFFFKLKL